MGRSDLPNVVLVGFMGAGKTTVGRLLSRQLARPFADLDAVIEARAGKPVARIFAEEGEEAFRRLEAEAVADLARPAGRVLAAGGGVLEDPANLRALQAGGVLVWLRAPLEVLLDRAVREGGRPLLEGPDPLVRARALYARREANYGRADLVVEAWGRPPAAVAAEVASRLPPTAAPAPRGPLWVELGPRSYPIWVGEGELARAGERAAEAGLAGRALLAWDAGVPSRYRETVLASLRGAGIDAAACKLPAGEQAKTLAHVAGLYEAALRAGVDRRSWMVSLGGGAAGDATGFCAATYLRGVPFVQLPTTLLAQVDAAVGGKTAVNLPQGKNLVGAFHQPRLVVCDPGTLRSLPRRELAGGLAEVVKYGAIADPGLFAFVEENLEALLAAEVGALERVVADSCRIKAAVVAADEREETGLREILNFGHTLGHALEAEAGFAGYLHGEAVAVGMTFAAELSCLAGLLERDACERMVTLLRRAGLPVSAPEADPARVWARVGLDKKAAGGRPRFVLLRSLGRAERARAVDEALVRQAAARVFAGREGTRRGAAG